MNCLLMAIIVMWTMKLWLMPSWLINGGQEQLNVTVYGSMVNDYGLMANKIIHGVLMVNKMWMVMNNIIFND